MLLMISTVVYWIVVEKEMIEIQTRVSTAAAVWGNASIFGMRTNAFSADCPFSKRENWKLKLGLGCLLLRLNLNFLDDGSVMQTRLAADFDTIGDFLGSISEFTDSLTSDSSVGLRVRRMAKSGGNSLAKAWRKGSRK